MKLHIHEMLECPSVCPSVCLHKLNVKTYHFSITPKLIYLQSSYVV